VAAFQASQWVKNPVPDRRDRAFQMSIDNTVAKKPTVPATPIHAFARTSGPIARRKGSSRWILMTKPAPSE
jgi:hypothetical protein